jgi:hypothetical protein
MSHTFFCPFMGNQPHQFRAEVKKFRNYSDDEDEECV